MNKRLLEMKQNTGLVHKIPGSTIHLFAATICLTILLSAVGTNGQERSIGLAETKKSEFSKFYEKSYALVIGIDKYENVPALKYATNDAKSIADMLTDHFGFDQKNVTMLLDAKASRNGIMRAFDELRRLARRDDRVFIFYAGHGHTETMPDGRQKGYILPCETDMTDLLTTAISTDQLNEISQVIAAKHLFFVLDACYGGSIFQRAAPISATAQDYLQVISTRKARTALTAGGQDQTVLDTGPGGHSVFTYYLINALTSGAGDLNGDGITTSAELFSFIGPRVTAESNRAQTPEYGILAGDTGGDFVFVPKSATLASASRATIASTPDSATVMIDGNNVGITPLSVPLSFDKHSVKLIKEGYRQKTDTIIVAQNGINSFDYNLKLIEVAVNITSNVDSALVFVDRQQVTVVVGFKASVALPLGTHMIQLRRDRFGIASANVDIVENGKYDLPFTLERAYTTLNLFIFPDTCGVYIDGIQQANGSGRLEIKTGTHVVTVKKDGYETFQESIDAKGSMLNLDVSLVPISETLVVTTSPQGAFVKVDNEVQGATPTTLQLGYPGHQVRIEKPGFKPVMFDEDVRASGKLSKNFKLALTTQSVANEIVSRRLLWHNTQRWSNVAMTMIAGMGWAVMASNASREYRSYQSATNIWDIDGRWTRYQLYSLNRNVLMGATLGFGLASLYSFLIDVDREAAYREAVNMDYRGMNFYDLESVDTCVGVSSPVIMDLEGGYGFTSLPGADVRLTVLPLGMTFNFPLGQRVWLRLGGAIYDVRPGLTTQSGVDPANDILWRTRAFSCKGGLGILIGRVRLTADYSYLFDPEGKSMHPLMPKSIYNITAGTEALPGLYLGAGVAIFQSRRIWGIRTDPSSHAQTFDISSDGPVYFPNLVVGIGL